MLHKPANDPGAQPLLGIVHADLLGLEEVGHDLLERVARLLFVGLRIMYWRAFI